MILNFHKIYELYHFISDIHNTFIMDAFSKANLSAFVRGGECLSTHVALYFYFYIFHCKCLCLGFVFSTFMDFVTHIKESLFILLIQRNAW